MPKLLKKLITFLLDTIAPPDPLIRRIEIMHPGQFMFEALATHPEDAIKEVLSFFPYRNETVKAALVELKSYGNKKIARLFGVLLYELLVEEQSELESFRNFTSPLIIPIPITKKKLRARGWNQCDLITRYLEERDVGKAFEVRYDVLVKVRENADQVGKGRKERFENLKDCFAVRDARAVQGKNIIVFDDIVTTGATLLEAKRALKKAGAKKILCVALAH